MAIFASATVSFAIIVPVTVFVSPVVTTVPVVSGNVIVRSPVGSVISIVVSCASDVPSTKAQSTVPLDTAVLIFIVAVVVIAPTASVPVVVKFSSPKEIAPELSVIDPAASARVPPLSVVPFTVVVARVVIVAEVCVPPTAPVIVGAVRVIVVSSALIPDAIELLSPNAV